MTVKDLLLIIERNLLMWFSIVFVVVLSIGAYAVLLVQPTYTSTVQYNAIDHVTDIASYKDYIMNASFQNEIQDRMAAKGYINQSNRNQLKEMQVVASPGNPTFSIKATAMTPLLAREYVTVTSDLFGKQFGNDFPNHHIGKINGPSKPTSPTSPNMKNYLLYGGIFAIVLATGIVILREFFGKYVYGVFYTEKLLGIPLYGSISYPNVKSHDQV